MTEDRQLASVPHLHDHGPGLDRRTFLRVLAAGGAVAALGLTTQAPSALAAGGTEALLLTCMDFRLMDEIVRYMDGRKMTDQYDHVILAGASLGAQTDKYPAWGKTFWDHLEVAIQLHQIKKVMVMDHRDCGAYKVILGQDLAGDPKAETAAHAKQLKSLESAIRAKYPKLSVETLLMDLKGQVEVIA
jgi:carbonic anhydrase